MRAGKRPFPALSGGFTYLGLLLLVAIMGITMTVAARVWQTTVQREKEAELLFIGDQIQAAIGQYYEQSPGEEKRYPMKLENLLLDSRFPNLKRHLRKIYTDPMTGTSNWGVVLSEEGGIQGVYSTSTQTPLKQAGFDEEHKSFEKTRQLSEWKFVYVPTSLTASDDVEDSMDLNSEPALDE